MTYVEATLHRTTVPPAHPGAYPPPPCLFYRHYSAGQGKSCSTSRIRLYRPAHADAHSTADSLLTQDLETQLCSCTVHTPE